MQVGGFLFLDRKWESDKHTIAKGIRYFGLLKQKPQVGTADLILAKS